MITPEEMGARLYRTLFPKPVLSLFERSLELAEAQGAGLRLKIFLNPLAEPVRVFQGLPWELLYREEAGEFLALNASTPVVRSLAVPQAPRSAELPTRIKILAANALPRAAEVLDLAGELKEMVASEVRGKLEVVPWTARVPELREMLDHHGPFDVLHFLGHAGFSPLFNEGVLCFVGRDGEEETVRAATLAQKLRGFSELRLIVLNACKTARSTASGHGNPFGGVAAALIQAGFPAVLAMQEVIADPAALALSRALYRYLARGAPLEGALAEARQAVFDLNPQGFEWAVPSLFLRSAPEEGPGGRAKDSPRREVSRLVDSAQALFLAGDFALAREACVRAIALDPQADRPRLFESLARMALGRPLSIRAAAELDTALQKLLAIEDREAAGVARLALGILRLDTVDPRRLLTTGVRSERLYSDLEASGRTPLEREIASALGASRDALLLFNLLS